MPMWTGDEERLVEMIFEVKDEGDGHFRMWGHKYEHEDTPHSVDLKFEQFVRMTYAP
jgi:hypothetical protein